MERVPQLWWRLLRLRRRRRRRRQRLQRHLHRLKLAAGRPTCRATGSACRARASACRARASTSRARASTSRATCHVIIRCDGCIWICDGCIWRLVLFRRSGVCWACCCSRRRRHAWLSSLPWRFAPRRGRRTRRGRAHRLQGTVLGGRRELPTLQRLVERVEVAGLVGEIARRGRPPMLRRKRPLEGAQAQLDARSIGHAPVKRRQRLRRRGSLPRFLFLCT